MKESKKNVCEQIKELLGEMNPEETRDFVNYIEGAVSAVKVMKRLKEEKKEAS